MTYKVIEIIGGLIKIKECSKSHPDHVIVAKYFHIQSLEP